MSQSELHLKQKCNVNQIELIKQAVGVDNSEPRLL